MQLIVMLGKDGAEIKCPGCDSMLSTVREQDRRVHVMQHPPAEKCCWSNRKLRVDRLSGYAEPWPEVKEEDPCESSEDETRTNTITKGHSQPTATIRPIRRTPRGTPAGGLGRTHLYRGRG